MTQNLIKIFRKCFYFSRLCVSPSLIAPPRSGKCDPVSHCVTFAALNYLNFPMITVADNSFYFNRFADGLRTEGTLFSQVKVITTTNHIIGFCSPSKPSGPGPGDTFLNEFLRFLFFSPQNSKFFGLGRRFRSGTCWKSAYSLNFSCFFWYSN